MPVCNEQANLPRRVAGLLEVLPDLAGRFEVAMIDHGSSDATPEVAHELAAGYPQLSVLSYPRPLDSATILREGLQATLGELVLFWSDAIADAHDFHRLLRVAPSTDAVAGRLGSSPANLAASRDAGQHPAVLLFNRRVATAWRGAETGETLLQYLLRKRYRIAELVLRPTAEQPAGRNAAAASGPPAMHALRMGKRSAAQTSAPHSSRRPLR